MPRKANRLHIRTYLTNLVKFLENLQEDNDKLQGGLSLPPAYLQAVGEFKLVGKAILRKHNDHRQKLGSRKDIYIERNL